ncbi:hypothetical protein PAPYR_7869 [Paratrimastix pyriformis]|uniref:Uncharacterized protein n=2 Tax=Paratrimastix pyriformis TaxID=342808 RepID=A0ABQ8UGD2_9EUKA|nr:hypothetical protein PAPYR_7869 [Paratrimastix pyriformis]
MDQLSRLSFTSTMIPEFGKLFGYLVASEKRIPSTKLLQRITCAIDSIHLWCHHFQFGVFQQARYCIASIDGDPVPARPVASVNPSTASPQSGLCPKSPSTVKQPPGKVTAHCIDPSAAPLQLGGAKKKDRVEEKADSNPFAVRPAVAHQQPAPRKGFCHAEGSLALPHGSGVEGERGGSSARGTGRAAEAGLWMVDPPTTRPDVRVPHQYQMVHGDADAQRPRIFSLIYLLDPPYSLPPPLALVARRIAGDMEGWGHVTPRLRPESGVLHLYVANMYDTHGDPRSRPTCGFGEPVHCFAAIRPVSKVTEHCQTASRKSDRTLHRPLSCPASAWRWYESATTRWYMGTRMPNAQEVPM